MATIKRKVIETSKLLDNQHDNAIDNINFDLDVGQGRAEPIMSYVQLLGPSQPSGATGGPLQVYRNHRPSRTSLTST